MERKESRPTIPAAACKDEPHAAAFIQSLSAGEERRVRLATLALEGRMTLDAEMRAWIAETLSPTQLEALERKGYRL